jgi:energy-coupling factor transporter transmembrane protein EcfT
MRLQLDPRTKLLILALINVVVFAASGQRVEWVCMGAVTLLLLLMGAYR